ncbi:MAG: HlyD family efflux transporter periplasmic adaptor subunit [Spirochaetales bacterium]|nr:HlyD family efflux transporter periplasmic adaptor subunit [Spirochaetales bacterium]
MSAHESIINLKSVRKPGHKKRVVTITLLLLFFTLIIVMSYLFLKPKQQTYVLNNYSTATVHLGDIDKRASVTGNFNIITNDVIITTEDGICTTINKKTGDTVKKGEVILKIESIKLLDERRELENELEQVKRNNLKSNQEYKRSVRDLNRSIDKKTLVVDRAFEELERSKDLFELNAITKKELLEVTDAYNDSVEDLEITKLQLADKIEDRTLELELIEFDLKRAETQLNKVNERIGKLDIKSVIDGTILDFKIKKGNRVESGDVLLQVGDLGTPFIEAFIPVKYSDDINIGADVVVTYDKKIYKGKLSLINSVTTDGKNGEKLLYSEVKLENIPENFIPGSSCNCEIILSVNKKVKVLERSEYVVSGKNRYVYVVKGNQGIKTEVKYGVINSSNVSIISGVEVGDKIITSSYNDFIEKEIIELKQEG